jgi:hypothetical protein
MFELVGAIHVHSIFSDGSGEIKEIAGYGNEAGLDFILLTDHNTLRALHEGYEGWYNNVLILVGYEINDKENKNHLLAFNVAETLSTRLPAKEYTKLIRESGGISFIAHPHEVRDSMKEHPPYPWTEWDTEDFTGMEIWNHMSEWMEGLTEQNKYNYFVHPLKSISAPFNVTLNKWDELNLKRRVVGIAGVDAHAHKVNLLGFFEFEVFPYKVLFKSIRTHILFEKEILPDPLNLSFASAKAELYNSLKNGRCFVSNFYHGDAKGFRFFLKADGKIYQMGDSVPFLVNSKLYVVIPDTIGTIKLIKDGKIYQSIDSNKAEFEVKDGGAYRVEVYLNGNAWIFSNHIRIGI